MSGSQSTTLVGSRRKTLTLANTESTLAQAFAGKPVERDRPQGVAAGRLAGVGQQAGTGGDGRIRWQCRGRPESF